MSTAVIAHTWIGRYDHVTREREGDVATEQERAELEQRVRAGEWITPGDVAKLLDVSRSTASRLFVEGSIGFRKKRRYRYGNPEDVLKVLAAYTTEHRGEPEPPSVSNDIKHGKPGAS